MDDALRSVLAQSSVLYVEDDPQVRRLLAEALGRYFGTVYEACDGKEGLEMFYAHPVDAVVADIDMPRLNGLEMVRRIRAADEYIPVIMLTAYADTDKLLEATELGLSKYLLKPLNPRELSATMEKVARKLQKQTDEISIGGDYLWHTTSQILLYQGDEVPLTGMERSLFAIFAENVDACVDYGTIVYTLWEEEESFEKALQTLKYHIRNLRKKLPGLSIRNHYGRGYVLHCV